MGWPMTIIEFESFNQSINQSINQSSNFSMYSHWLQILKSSGPVLIAPWLSECDWFNLRFSRSFTHWKGYETCSESQEPAQSLWWLEWVSVMSRVSQPEHGAGRSWPIRREAVTGDLVWRTDTSLTESGMQQQQQQHQRHVGSCCCCGVEEEIMRSFVATFFPLILIACSLKTFFSVI